MSRMAILIFILFCASLDLQNKKIILCDEFCATNKIKIEVEANKANEFAAKLE